ncbi:MAG TPA: hypothetical protein VFJ57_13805 [Solirubrobacterales bacterium]|nr:hypothetical protein [Solirubrobacterales bacterium]
MRDLDHDRIPFDGERDSGRSALGVDRPRRRHARQHLAVRSHDFGATVHRRAQRRPRRHRDVERETLGALAREQLRGELDTPGDRRQQQARVLLGLGEEERFAVCRRARRASRPPVFGGERDVATTDGDRFGRRPGKLEVDERVGGDIAASVGFFQRQVHFAHVAFLVGGADRQRRFEQLRLTADRHQRFGRRFDFL